MNTYSIKIAFRGISPMIWPRLRIDGNTSIADLHYIIQIAMGWDDDYLHHFHIHGIDYGLGRAGCGSFRHAAELVFIVDFTFDVGDRFTYTYNYFEFWLCDIRRWLEDYDFIRFSRPSVNKQLKEPFPDLR